MSRNFFKPVDEKTQSCTCGVARARTKMVRLITAPLNNGDIMELAYLPLTFTKHFCKLGTMKIKKKQLAKLAFRAYMVYSICADMIVIGGIVYIIFF